MSRFVVVAVLAAVMAACAPEKPIQPSKSASTACAPEKPSQPSGSASTALPPRPKLDMSTPDRALKSYWAQRDWYMRVNLELTKNASAKRPAAAEVFAAVVTGELLPYWRDFGKEPQVEKYQRDIESVKQETESRAVALVRIRNVSLIPEGVTPTSRQMHQRERGVIFRYVIEKEGSDWRIAEVWKDETLLGLGWRNQYSVHTPLFPFYVLSE